MEESEVETDVGLLLLLPVYVEVGYTQRTICCSEAGADG